MISFDVVTLFPEFFESFAQVGVVGTAIRENKISLNTVNPRKFTQDKHQSVDDRPFGGGDGMLMMAQPLALAVADIKARALAAASEVGPVILLSAHGKTLNHQTVKRLAGCRQITLVCGRYGGVDQRFITRYVSEELSLGDFILSGGEIAAQAVIDSVARFVPGVLGHQESAAKDSFSAGGLEHPQFTRPREFEGLKVPEFLLSGDHASVAQKQRWAGLMITVKRRPDLLQGYSEAELKMARLWYDSLESWERESLGIS